MEAPLAHESAPPGCPGILSILGCLLVEDFLDGQESPTLSWKGPVGSRIAFLTLVLTSGHDCSLNMVEASNSCRGIYQEAEAELVVQSPGLTDREPGLEVDAVW